MAGRSAAGRLLFAGLAALAIAQLLSQAFVVPPQAPPRAQLQQGALLGGAVALAPQAANAFGNELRDDGFGGAELTALAIPFVFVVLAYLEWEGQQEPTDNVTGVGTVGKQIDGPGKGAYFRRSPESG
uniref:PSII 6.1 kDa protein n=1 Tax=Alexandrium monilatum TaxID=311494 RepID=A0A7S4T4P7_9DINO